MFPLRNWEASIILIKKFSHIFSDPPRWDSTCRSEQKQAVLCGWVYLLVLCDGMPGIIVLLFMIDHKRFITVCSFLLSRCAILSWDHWQPHLMMGYETKVWFQPSQPWLRLDLEDVCILSDNYAFFLFEIGLHRAKPVPPPRSHSLEASSQAAAKKAEGERGGNACHLSENLAKNDENLMGEYVALRLAPALLLFGWKVDRKMVSSHVIIRREQRVRVACQACLINDATMAAQLWFSTCSWCWSLSPTSKDEFL